ncbi:MAG: PaaI family thioesterase [Halieaceae bacterium]|nr:PaaI family thioesterase [Halieaceae bacterium]MCP4466010.1 PaaI family thioesterase [Halieaceae bacterium]MCP4842917.1 PaaI family thioesterase [Halieaceae bacterium]MDG2412645.1 PaaI family thioesterase [Halioglobus sp.]
MNSLTLEEKLRVVKMMGEFIPHTSGLGVELHSIEDGELTLRLPYQQQLVGDAETGVLHSGALTVLLDQTLGLSAVCSNDIAPSVTPTLDLRIDHLGIAPPGSDIFATGKVLRATRKILFVDGFAWCDAPDKPIARATGTWVRVMDIDLEWIKSMGRGSA